MSISIVIPSTGKRTEILYETVMAALKAVENIESEIILITNPEKPVPFSNSKLKVVHVDFNNVSACRNLGAKTARFDTVLFIDDDILISELNLIRINEVLGSLESPYLMNLVWIHSEKVEILKRETLLGKFTVQSQGFDSFCKRYTSILKMDDWQANSLFESSLRKEFSEACFVMNKAFFIKIGGFSERFYFGNEGYDFLTKLQQHRWYYYIDGRNIVGHNEWDKYCDWKFSDLRMLGDAKLVNQQITDDEFNSKFRRNKINNIFLKLIYGIFVYYLRPLVKIIIGWLPPKGAGFSLAFKLYNRYLLSIFWHTITWKTIFDQFKQID